MSTEFEYGVFIEECKSRFLCKVAIKGQEEVCYVSSSSKLAPFIELTGREVLLIKNIGDKNKTAYTLHAVKTCEGYVLLNLGFINKLLMTEFNKQESIYSGAGTISREKKVSTLKADFLIEGEYKTIVEAKGVLAEDKVAYLPAMRVDRAVSQLEQFTILLKEDYFVDYYFVLMNPVINHLKLDKTKVQFYKLFRKCLRKGMRLFIYKAVWDEERCSVVRYYEAEKAFIAQLSQ